MEKSQQQIDKKIIDLVSGLMKVMDFEVEIEEKYENESPRINVVSQEAGFLIGQNGATLASLEHLVKATAYKQLGSPQFFTLDVNDYKKSRIDFLEQTVAVAAEDVLLTRRAHFFQPMSAFERRIVHTIIANRYLELTTQSDGDGELRRVIVKIKV